MRVLWGGGRRGVRTGRSIDRSRVRARPYLCAGNLAEDDGAAIARRRGCRRAVEVRALAYDDAGAAVEGPRPAGRVPLAVVALAGVARRTVRRDPFALCAAAVQGRRSDRGATCGWGGSPSAARGAGAESGGRSVVRKAAVDRW
eukprot:5174485-Prymnesium_polylepis.1